jgi:amphi-Trp domain-containing protein
VSANEKIDYAATIEATEAAEYLTRIAEGLIAGTLGFSVGEQQVQLRPGETVKFEIEASGKPGDDRGSLAIDISWKIRSKPAVPALEITTAPTEIAAPAPETAETAAPDEG